MNGKIIVNAVIFLTILFGLYTIYDHQEKYLGGVPAKQCRSGRTVSQPRSHFTTGAPSVSVEAGVGFDQELFNSTDNLDEMLTITMEKHFGDIRSNAFEILDQYGRLTDENTLFDLKSSVRSFLAKSKIIHDLREMHKGTFVANCRDTATEAGGPVPACQRHINQPVLQENRRQNRVVQQTKPRG